MSGHLRLLHSPVSERAQLDLPGKRKSGTPSEMNLGVDPIPTLHTYLGNFILAKTEVGVRRKDLKREAPTPTKHLLILVK